MSELSELVALPVSASTLSVQTNCAFSLRTCDDSAYAAANAPQALYYFLLANPSPAAGFLDFFILNPVFQQLERQAR